MAYNRLYLKTGDELNEDVFKRIDDGIAEALVPEAKDQLTETVNLFKDAENYWNSGFLQSLNTDLQTFGKDSLVNVKGTFNNTVAYVSSPLIRFDSADSNSMLLSINSSQFFRQFYIYNSAGKILFSCGNTSTATYFKSGITSSDVNLFKKDATMINEYPQLTSALVYNKLPINADTIAEFNKYFLDNVGNPDNYPTYSKNEVVYIYFTLKTTTARPSTEEEVSEWFLKQISYTSCNLITTYNTYQLSSLAIPSTTAKKYFNSSIMNTVIDEIGEFINTIGVDNLTTKTTSTSKTYSSAMTENFYPAAYDGYYIAYNFNITDVSAPTYTGVQAYTGYKITMPIPIDVSIDNATYTCTPYLRHYALCSANGTLLYQAQNASNLTITREWCENNSIDPDLVRYLVVSNTTTYHDTFKVVATVTKKHIYYELPNLKLTDDQGGGSSSSGGVNTGASNLITLENVDRIVAIGDSYTESHYTIKDKSWISKVSLLSDYNYDNFAISGDTYRGQLNKIRTGTYSYASTSGMTWEKLHPTHAIMISKTNDTKYMNCQQFIYDMIATIETTKGLGAIPIICTEYHVSNHNFVQSAFDYYAKKYGGYYIDLTEKDYVLRGTDYAPFWGGSHPGTRTNHIFSDVITDYINKNLPRPYSSIKVFRPRDSSLVSDLDNYIFGTIEERAEKFKEISICHSALRDSSLYDNCTNQSNSKVESEYFKLMTGAAVEFDKVCLIDVILPTTVHDISQVKLITNTLDGVNCYVKDVLAEPYPSPAFCRRFDIAEVLDETRVAVGNKYTSNKTTGATYTVVEVLYDQVESDNGFVDGTILICSGNKSTSAYNSSTLTLTSGTGDATLSCTYEAVGLSSDYPSGKQDIGHYVLLDEYGVVEGDVLKRAVDYDKITFLLVSDSTFNLRNVEIEFKGNITKTRNTPVYNNTLPSSYYNTQESLIPHTTFDADNISYWLKSDLSACDLAPEVPVDNVLPKNITSIVTLTPEDGVISQHFKDTSAGSTYNANHKVKVWARYFPDVFDSTTMVYPDDSTITDNSFDWAKLNIKLYQSKTNVKNDDAVKMTKLVGLHWTEVELDITLPPNANSWYIGLSAEDKPIQLAYCDVI